MRSLCAKFQKRNEPTREDDHKGKEFCVKALPRSNRPNVLISVKPIDSKIVTLVTMATHLFSALMSFEVKCNLIKNKHAKT